MNWYLSVVKNYVGFSGRARRQEFWMFALFNAIFAIALNVLDSVIGTSVPGIIYALALLLPAIAVGIRRLHDTGRSGWWLLLYFTCVGIIVLIVWWAAEGEANDNAYGSNPKLNPVQV